MTGKQRAAVGLAGALAVAFVASLVLTAPISEADKAANVRERMEQAKAGERTAAEMDSAVRSDRRQRDNEQQTRDAVRDALKK